MKFSENWLRSHVPTSANRDGLAATLTAIGLEVEEVTALGDGHKPLWITEYGWERDPPTQAARLRAALSWMASRSYITQAHLHMLHDQGTETFGLTRLDPPGDITRQTRFVPKVPIYQAFKDYPRAPATAPTPAPGSQPTAPSPPAPAASPAPATPASPP